MPSRQAKTFNVSLIIVLLLILINVLLIGCVLLAILNLTELSRMEGTLIRAAWDGENLSYKKTKTIDR